MNMFEEARAMSGTLALCKITQRELADKLGVSQSYIANKLRLLTLPRDIEQTISVGGVSERHVRTLLRLHDNELIRTLLYRVIDEELTVRECEVLVDMHLVSHPKKKPQATRADGIGAFVDGVSRGVDTLISLGVEANAKTSYYGDKMYITVCINGV